MENLASRPVRMVFTSRAGGASASPYDSFNLAEHVGDDPEAVRANRERLAGILGLPAEDFVWMEQLHTNTVTVVDGPQEEPVPATDALVTTQVGLALCVLVADCTPVLLSDHAAGVIGAVHAGRMGARNGIVKRTVEKMVELGAKPANIQALLGPAAAGESYEVPAEMAADVEAHLPGSATTTAKGTPGLDIRAGIVRQLMSVGVTHIDADPRDTITDDAFFSHRREGTTGRQAGVIWLTGAK
ncbi:peptidoglycan editing factor PgeF [Corynebacterium imitans]|uniref:peptidoglycan editing factor PgeF n=1 Tax=Corynebacterium imitans TaxID=156978 RepID=UPI00254D415B|nr:peptidoglycan editing factor PgeF [Corynebacterium imitans]MDK8305744.1 peptidoglycan editing factor PgeF [Corynebacterium imitans]MDK8636790.1 peptidoglycan editing factor PgeF [Corynebacterium imitans]MDK8772405.1 peptidoglycan editing factor PgeF [Corynebacterium imitans]